MMCRLTKGIARSFKLVIHSFYCALRREMACLINLIRIGLVVGEPLFAVY